MTDPIIFPTSGALIGTIRQSTAAAATFHLKGTADDHDQQSHARGGLADTAEDQPRERPADAPDDWFADDDVLAEAQALAADKALNVPKPTQERIRKNLRSIRKSKRPGGELRGNSYTRRDRAEALFREFGGGKRGWCPCTHCGIKVAPKGRDGYGYMQQDKILTIKEGGTYGSKTKFPNLIPSCGGCNSGRNDEPFPVRPAWETAAAAAATIETFATETPYPLDTELIGEPSTATGTPIPDPDEDDQPEPVTGTYQIRRVDAWFGAYDQHIIDGDVVDPTTVEETP